jgi:hypothetical protein
MTPISIIITAKFQKTIKLFIVKVVVFNWFVFGITEFLFIS